MINAKVGDAVVRNMGGVIMTFMVTEVTEDKIICGWWTFDKATGAEIDEDLNWGPPPLSTGSYITAPNQSVEKNGKVSTE